MSCYNNDLPVSPFQFPAGAVLPAAPATIHSYLINPRGEVVTIASTTDAALFSIQNPGWSYREYGVGDFD